MRIVARWFAIACIGLGGAWQRPDGADRFVLDNGVTVILRPVAGTGWVGMETFYRVGFVDEPEGLTQASHLIEHLVCRAATAGHAPGTAMDRINERGMANAETLAPFTHYDAMVPADMLDQVLRIEAQRLTSLRIDAAIVEQEAPRCYGEAAAVEGLAEAPMFKFALMAAGQAWRYGATRALVKGGLVEAPVETLRAFHQRYYTPSHLTIVLVGDFERAATEQLVRDHLGTIPSPAGPARAPIDWAGVPRDSTVRWDSTARGLLLAWAPPERADERLVLSLWSTVAMQQLSTDPAILKHATFALGTMHTYPVGDLPLFVYATVRPEAGADAAGQIEARARELLGRKPTETDLLQLRGLLDQMTSPPVLTGDMVVQRAKQFARSMQRDEGRATGMVLGHTALQMGLAEMVLGQDAALAARVRAMDAEQIAAITALAVDPARTLIIRLEPLEK